MIISEFRTRIVVLLLIVIVVVGINGGYIYAYEQLPIVDYFHFEELKHHVPLSTSPSETVEDLFEPWSMAQSIEHARRVGYDLDGIRHISDDESNTEVYFFIAVVQPVYSRNVLAGIPQRDSRDWNASPIVLPPFHRTAPDFHIEGAPIYSHVLTTVKVLDVLEQSRVTTLTPGEYISIVEPYYVQDRRLNSGSVQDDSIRVILNQGSRVEFTYYPMESGETYFLCGGYYPHTIQLDSFVKGNYSISQAVFCLSDPEKPVGTGFGPWGYGCEDTGNDLSLEEYTQIVLRNRKEELQKLYGDQISAYVNE